MKIARALLPNAKKRADCTARAAQRAGSSARCAAGGGGRERRGGGEAYGGRVPAVRDVADGGLHEQRLVRDALDVHLLVRLHVVQAQAASDLVPRALHLRQAAHVREEACTVHTQSAEADAEAEAHASQENRMHDASARALDVERGLVARVRVRYGTADATRAGRSMRRRDAAQCILPRECAAEFASPRESLAAPERPSQLRVRAACLSLITVVCVCVVRERTREPRDDWGAELRARAQTRQQDETAELTRGHRSAISAQARAN